MRLNLAERLQALALAALLATSVHAATLQGIIFDEETKNPLARTTVILQPLPGTRAAAASILANERGAYTFTGVTPGWYIIQARRTGYANAEYGQSHPGRPGTPLEVTDTDPADTFPIVMRHQAAIAGAVVDDNSIGIPGWPVYVYTAQQPIRRVAQGITDDRGDFRIGELDPGVYIVRSGGGRLDDTIALLPSYYKYGTAVIGAEQVRVRLGETQSFATIHTQEGLLYELTGTVVTPESRSARLTLSTDTSRGVVASAAGDFTSANLPPGDAELLLEGPSCAGYQRILLDRNMFARADCVPLAPPVVDWQIGGQKSSVSYPLVARRLDLDGPGPEQILDAGKTLTPGRWEMTIRDATDHYVLSIQGDESKTAKPGGAWFPVELNNAPHIRVTLSSRPAAISGVVSSAGKPSVGAPVYLQRMNPEAPGQPVQTWTARADAHGAYAFKGLPPGTYRALSSFELDFDDAGAGGRSLPVNLREGDTLTQPLELILY
jgi:hypothetical protein